MFDLYTFCTPNGWKASVALEELGLRYEPKIVDITKGEQKERGYLKLNPNGCIPTLVDRDADDLVIFESGAMLLYLAEKTGRLLPTDHAGRSRVIQWLMLQMGGVGPMMGQANVFYRYFPKRIPEVINRYQNESRRLFEVLNRQLASTEYLAGDYSIADIAHWCWVRTHRWSGVSIDGLTHLRRWLDAIAARPAARRGVRVPFDVSYVLREDDTDGVRRFRERARRVVTGSPN